MNLPITEVIEKHMDEITDPGFLEFVKGMKMFLDSQPKEKPIVYKLVYDPETFLVTERTIDETDKPYIPITLDEFLATKLNFRSLRIVGDKYEEVIPEKPDSKLPLAQGEKWKTTESNMLIPGNDRGWDERKNS